MKKLKEIKLTKLSSENLKKIKGGMLVVTCTCRCGCADDTVVSSAATGASDCASTQK